MEIKVIKRTGDVTGFDASKIQTAIGNAVLSTDENRRLPPQEATNLIGEYTQSVIKVIEHRYLPRGVVHIEEIQDLIELALMRAEDRKAAHNFVVYRENRAKERKLANQAPVDPIDTRMNQIIDPLKTYIKQFNNPVYGDILSELDEILAQAKDELVSNPTDADIYETILITMRTRVEEMPEWSHVCGVFVTFNIVTEVNNTLGVDIENDPVGAFKAYIKHGVESNQLDGALDSWFDLDQIANALGNIINPNATLLGITTLYDRYLIQDSGKRYETPHWLFMRVAMGLCLNSSVVNKTKSAIEYYKVMNNFDYMPSTPTLFNSGTPHSQMSSCYISTVPDDLAAIYDGFKDNALLSKFAGGLGNDWTRVRANHSWIKSTNGESQGVIPFLKVNDSTAIAVNQGGKRKGAICCYLSTWHLDLLDFLELRKNTGDPRRRTEDLNTANWIPDLFMQRVLEDKEWTLFCPNEATDLHDLYGLEFNERYEHYEQLAKEGKMRLHATYPAKDIWRKMVAMIFETAHPWMTFKDPMNLRNPQQHVGVIHSSNLCCVAADQLVVTARGTFTVKELYDDAGLNVVPGHDGMYQATKMVLPRPNAPMCVVHTTDGFTHKVTPDHPLWVEGVGWVEAQHLRVGNRVLLQQFHRVFGPDGLDASALSDLDNVHFMYTEFKRLPKCIWTANIAATSMYLRELYTRHGYMPNDMPGSSAMITSTSKQLIAELQILWANFGVMSTITDMGGGSYRLLINRAKSIAIVDAIFNNDFTVYQSDEMVTCISGVVQLAEPEDAYCLTVSSDTHAWTANGFITKNTEIALNTKSDADKPENNEIAVCNLGSINLVNHLTKDYMGKYSIDKAKLKASVEMAIEMLDNIIDINYYAVEAARRSNLKHRPIGLGIMGFQDMLYMLNISYGSEAAVKVADEVMEYISYYAISKSCELASDRGRYPSYEGSLWSQGIFPRDTQAHLKAARPDGMFIMNNDTVLGEDAWTQLKNKVAEFGMRNSNVMAIAPTATISNICGVSQSIEPAYKNLFVKSNLSGNFTVINRYLINRLRELKLWDRMMINELKANDGSVLAIKRIPDEVKTEFLTAFELNPKWIIEAAARRQKWIDQAQSLNLYVAGADGNKISTMYQMCWLLGLKTTYYLRALGKSSNEKSTVTTSSLNAVDNKREIKPTQPIVEDKQEEFVVGQAAAVPAACSIDNPDCEACQ